MVTCQNLQDQVTVSCDQIIKDAQHALQHLDYTDFDLGIVVVNDDMIQQYNKQYRKKDKSTDILSFPFHPDIKAGERILVQHEDDKNLGDIIISAPYVDRYCNEHDMNFDARIQRLLVHGICHLLGYDHQTESEYQEMYTQEKKLLDVLNSYE